MLTLGVSVNRRGLDFTVEQRALMELLQPNLLQAYTMAQDSAQAASRIQAERESTAIAAGGGLCQIDAMGKVKWATSMVDKLLAFYFPSERPRSGYLPPSILQVIAEALRKSGEGELLAFKRRSWDFAREHGTLRMHLAASTTGQSWQLLFTEDRREPTAEELAARHGLSKREAETLFWIGQGKANDEIGIIMAIGTRTVEKYVERLFEKLHVYNRTAAARVAMGK